MTMKSMVGKGREVISMILDPIGFAQNVIGDIFFDPLCGPGAIVGTGQLNHRTVTVIANDAKVANPKFPVVYAGVIGMEEAYKMAAAVYATMEADSGNQPHKKRPLVLIVDSPGNAPGKIEEIFGMNKATGAYQLALAEARQRGHPVVAMIIGRAISGAFLCHGLQADRILSLSGEYGTMIHVMPITSIARITKMDIETLKELSKANPVFASGAEYFFQLGGIEEIVEEIDQMRAAIIRHISEVYVLNAKGESQQNGPWGRGLLGAHRGGRKTRAEVLERMYKQFRMIESEYL